MSTGPLKVSLERADVTIVTDKILGNKQLGINYDILAHKAAIKTQPVPPTSAHRKMQGREIRRLREIRQSPIVHVLKVTIQLKHPKYQGFKTVHYADWIPGEEPKRDLIKRLIQQTIRQARTKLKAKPISKELHWDVDTKFLGKKNNGRVFAEDGQILQMHVKKNINALYKEKKPELINRYVGIELEFCAPIKEINFAIELFKSGIHKFAQLKHDGSLRPQMGETGYELAILLKETELKSGMKRVCDLLKKVNAQAVDRRCGLHVHIDMRKRNKDVVYSNFVSCQNVLLKLVHPDRRNNEFCQSVTSKKFPIEFTGDRHERYKTVNAAAYYKYRTLEIRMHEGSIDYNQIVNWVGILIRIANGKKKIKDNVISLTTLKKRFNLNKRLHEYAVERSCYFQVNNPPPRQANQRRPEQAGTVNDLRDQLGLDPLPDEPIVNREPDYIFTTNRIVVPTNR